MIKPRFDRMDITERVEELVDICNAIHWELITWKGNSDHFTLEQVCGERTKEFVLPQNWQQFRNSLENGLTTRFGSHNESKLQNRFANYLIDKLHEVLLPTFSLASHYYNATVEPFNEIANSGNSIRTPVEERILANNRFSGKINNALFYCNLSVIKKIREFIPELYNQYSRIWNEYIDLENTRTYPMRAISGPTLIDQEPQQMRPGVKLQWNGAANTLYDVFRQLKNHHLPKGETLIEDGYDQIARFIQQSFVGFDEVATSTIRGELTKNNRPRKSFNRKDLDLTEPD